MRENDIIIHKEYKEDILFALNTAISKIENVISEIEKNIKLKSSNNISKEVKELMELLGEPDELRLEHLKEKITRLKTVKQELDK